MLSTLQRLGPKRRPPPVPIADHASTDGECLLSSGRGSTTRLLADIVPAGYGTNGWTAPTGRSGTKRSRR
jgi:hypothetical protein